MLVNYRCLNLCLFTFLITLLSSTALFCSDLTSSDDKDTPCFLETPIRNPLLLRSSGNSLVLPCHVARSKRSTVQWWYTDPQKVASHQIYPVYPPVRPTVLRFVTSLTPESKNANETDILDASILLRYVNVDDTGIYRCIIRPWASDSENQIKNILTSDDSNAESLSYQVQLTGPRLCQSNPSALPCFTVMRTSSPTVLDGYQTSFLQCVVKTYNRPVTVFWVVGDSSVNSLLITDYLTTNQYNGDRLRRVFPLSPFDYSIELSLNRSIPERVYSCVIDGATELETTLFTYLVRTIDLGEVGNKTSNATSNPEKIAAHDTLNVEQVLSLREDQKVSSEEDNLGEENVPDVAKKEEKEKEDEDEEEEEDDDEKEKRSSKV